MGKLKVGYILSYYSPNYIRTTVLIESIKKISGVELFQIRNSRKNFLRYAETLLKLLVARIKYNPDLYILGFRGHEIYLPVRMITMGKKLVYDQFMSPYDSLVNEREVFKVDSLLGRLTFIYEKLMLRFSHLLLTDTVSHAKYFAKLFNIPLEKFIVVPIGTEEREVIEVPGKKINNNQIFTVFTYATVLPLHGFEYIVKAAQMLRDEPVRFIIAGSDRKGTLEALISKHNSGNIEHHLWIPHSELLSYIISSDVCLGGPFGTTGQAQRVVTGKTYNMMSVGRAVIISNSEPHFLFKDKYDCIKIDPGSASSIANAIRWCLNNRDKLTRIGINAKDSFEKNYSQEIIGNIIAKAITEEK